MKNSTFTSLIILILYSIPSFSQSSSSSCNTSESINVSSCDSLISPSGKILDSTGIYLDTIPNVAGCDSILLINLNVNSSKSTNLAISSCDSLLTVTGKIWYVSGTFLDTISTIKGCDSIIIYNYTNGQTILDTVSSVCDSFHSVTGKTWKVTGKYEDTIVTPSGCDTIYKYDLTIINSTFDTLDPYSCDSFISTSGKIFYSTGVYEDTLTNSDGCNLFRTYNLTIGQMKFNLQNLIVCDSFISPSGKIWKTSGLYYDTVMHASGCDSLYEISLQVGAFYDTIIDSVCNSFTSPSGMMIDSTGVFQDTIAGYKCDSIIYTLKIEVNYSSKDTNTYFDCDTVFSSVSSNFWTQSGIYLDTVFISQFGCDSSVYSVVEIGNTFTAVNESHCWSYTLPSGKATLTKSGKYFDTISSVAGCDSVLYITLEINIADTTVINKSDRLVAFVSGASYQWLDCNNSLSPIPGATSYEYIPSSLGTFSLEVKKYGCIDTSSCHTTTSLVGLNEIKDEFSPIIYPNPFDDKVNINFQHSINNGQLSIIDISGKLVYQKAVQNISSFTIDLEDFKKGIYLLKIETDNSIKTIKLIKN